MFEINYLKSVLLDFVSQAVSTQIFCVVYFNNSLEKRGESVNNAELI